MEKGNLTFNSLQGSIPIAQITAQLLVRRQVDFIRSSQYVTTNQDEIGHLIISNYFAVPQPEQTLFHIYKLITISFFHHNKTIVLAQMPNYWGINPKDNTTIEWYYREESGCELQLMTTCRDTPPFRTIRRDSCSGEIVGGLSPTKCQAIPFPFSPYFLRQLQGNLLVTSSSKPMHCLKTPKNEYISHVQYSWSMSEEEVVLPTVAIVNVNPEHIIVYPGFFLTGRPVTSNVSSLIIFYNNTANLRNISVFDISQYLPTNNTRLTKMLEDQALNNLMGSMEDINAFSQSHSSSFYDKWPYISLILRRIIFVAGALLIFCTFTCKRKHLVKCV